MDIWRVLPDSERVHWALVPFKSVGPLRFGMPADEASSLLAGVIAYPPDEYKNWWPQRHRGYGRSSVQRAGDRLITRPVFLSDPAMEDVHHELPSEAWDFF